MTASKTEEAKSSVKATPTPTPLPWGAVLTCGFILLSNYVSMVMVFPLIPFMVADFFPEMPKEELGYKVGFLGSAYFVGTFCASIIFGRMADVYVPFFLVLLRLVSSSFSFSFFFLLLSLQVLLVQSPCWGLHFLQRWVPCVLFDLSLVPFCRYGRKKTMMIGIVGTICAILLFGFSKYFWVALLARFLWGLLNGNLGVVKTALTELCDDSNQAAGFAILGVNGGVSRLIGPSIGSFLSQPAQKFESFKGGVFEQFPYLLPCLVVIGLAVFTLCLMVPCLPETLKGACSGHACTVMCACMCFLEPLQNFVCAGRKSSRSRTTLCPRFDLLDFARASRLNNSRGSAKVVESLTTKK